MQTHFDTDNYANNSETGDIYAALIHCHCGLYNMKNTAFKNSLQHYTQRQHTTTLRQCPAATLLGGVTGLRQGPSACAGQLWPYAASPRRRPRGARHSALNHASAMHMHCCSICMTRTFYSAPQCSHCKCCTSCGNSVRLSVRLSVPPAVCHTPVLFQNDGT